MAENAQKIQMKIDDSQARNSYANAFRHQSNAHEVILETGVNIVAPKQKAEDPTQMNFKIDNRLVMNYVTAKRLAGMLVQVVQAHEKQFGEIKNDAPPAQG